MCIKQAWPVLRMRTQQNASIDTIVTTLSHKRTQCGRPMQIANCSACGRNIGGENHNWLGDNQPVGYFAQAGNLEVPGVTDMMENDMVRGISLDWFCEGVGHCERDLSPLEYRLLCVLLLIPLAVLNQSPSRLRRIAQLKKHWDAFKSVSGMSSDTDAQHLILGVLVRAKQARVVPDLVMAGIDLRLPGARVEAEAAFCKGVRAALANDDIKHIVREVQDRIKHVEESRQASAPRSSA